MTTYGPYKRLIITTSDAIITLTGNILATITGCDGGAPPQDYSITDGGSQNVTSDASKTAGPDDYSCYAGDSSSSVDHQPLASRSDMSESVSRTSNFEETTTDDECGSPDNSESEQWFTPPSSPISSDSESQLGETSVKVEPIGNKRKLNKNGAGSDVKEEPLAIRRRISHEKPYSCDTCGKTFAQPHTLSRHVRAHRGEKPYSCNACGKVYAYRINLSKHVSIHTGEIPFCCKACGKTFAHSYQLYTHRCEAILI